ncbi:MAG: hypothetical protein N2578_09050 [Bdellovibrionaceae bacterium]|nr:hypothetical protein [Pseudobdellovibrionaceae bacterium]
MDLVILSLASVVLFTLSCYLLIRSLLTPVPVFNRTRYSKAALRLEKAYKVFAFGLLTLFFLYAVIVSFYRVFATL